MGCVESAHLVYSPSSSFSLPVTSTTANTAVYPGYFCLQVGSDKREQLSSNHFCDIFFTSRPNSYSPPPLVRPRPVCLGNNNTVFTDYCSNRMYVYMCAVDDIPDGRHYNAGVLSNPGLSVLEVRGLLQPIPVT